MLEKIQEWAIKVQRVIFIVAISFMLLTLAGNVAMRYLLGKPLIWSEEIASLMQGGIAFLGIGYCFARKKHTELTLVYDFLPARVRALFDVITNGIILFCLYMLTVVSFDLVSRQMIPLGTVTWLKIGYFYLMVPIGFIVGAVYIATIFINAVRRVCAPQPAADPTTDTVAAGGEK